MAETNHPADIVTEYHSIYGFHTMTTPIRAVLNQSDDFADLTCSDWNDNVRNIADMVTDLVTVVKVFHPVDTVFDRYTVRVYPEAGARPIPLGTGALGINGTGTDIGWTKAVQWTITFRDTAASSVKLVMLDAGSFDDFDIIVSLAGQTALAAIITEFTSMANGWSSANNERPSIWLQASKTLNEKLRRQYRMV